MDDSRSQFEALLAQMPGPGFPGYKAFSEMDAAERKALFVLVKKDLKAPPFMEEFKDYPFFHGSYKPPSSIEEHVKGLDAVHEAMGQLANTLSDTRAQLHQAADSEGLTQREFCDRVFDGVYDELGEEDAERVRLFFDVWWPQSSAPGGPAPRRSSGVPLESLISLQRMVSRVRKRRLEAQLVYANELSAQREIALPLVVRQHDVPDEIARRIFRTPEMFEGYNSFHFQMGLLNGQMMYELLEPARQFISEAGSLMVEMFGDKKDFIQGFFESIPPKTVMASYLRAGLNYERQEAARIFRLGKPQEIGVILL